MRSRAERAWAYRGRPRGRFHSYDDMRLLEYLAEVAVKHRIDMNVFFGKFVEAWENQKAKCKELKIRCRGKTRGSAIFLITAGDRAIAQFPVPEYILKETAPLREFEYVAKKAERALTQEKAGSQSEHSQIGNLTAGMKKVSLRATVTEISEPKFALTRFNNYVRLANATLSDETGTIKLTLWNDQIESVSPNDNVQIENAKVIRFRGELQLKTGKNSTMKVLEENSIATHVSPKNA